MRVCCDCGVWLGRDSFSSNQWHKGDGASRCHACVNGGSSSSASRNVNAARENKSNSAEFDGYALSNPFASGSFRWVSEGTYTSGARKGEACVAKWFKSGAVYEVRAIESLLSHTLDEIVFL